MPWLSVLVPTLNGEEFISEALASVEREGDRGIHCIVVDGGSRDRTVALVKVFAERMPITLLERPDSPGWVWSTNLALSLADAAHCCLLHQDDLWLPGRAAAMKRIVTEDAQIALVTHSVRYVDRVGNDVGRLSCPWRPWPARLKGTEATDRLLVQNFISTPGAVFRTDLARTCGGFDEALWYTADWDFWLKLAKAGNVAYCPRDLAAFRLHADSQTARRSVDQAVFHEQLDIVLRRHLGETTTTRVRRAARLSVQVNTALAYESHGGTANWRVIVRDALSAGPPAWLIFLHVSRIAARISARIRARGLVASLASSFRRHRPLRFVVVGAINALFGYTLYAALVFLGAGVGKASLVSLVGSILFGFLTQGKVVFVGFGKWSFFKFLAVWAILYGVFIGFVFGAESAGINNYIGGALAAPLIAVVSYWLQSRFVFAPSAGEEAGRS